MRAELEQHQETLSSESQQRFVCVEVARGDCPAVLSVFGAAFGLRRVGRSGKVPSGSDADSDLGSAGSLPSTCHSRLARDSIRGVACRMVETAPVISRAPAGILATELWYVKDGPADRRV